MSSQNWKEYVTQEQYETICTEIENAHHEGFNAGFSAGQASGRSEAIERLKEGTWADENGLWHFADAHLEAAKNPNV